VGIGSNLDDPARHVREALGALGRLGALRASALYRSEPLGDPDQPWYVNAAATLETALEPPALLAELRNLEQAAGRPAERPRWGPRVLDLDLLLLGDCVLETPELTLPHPGLGGRRFVLEPLCEIAPELVDPRSGKSVADLLRDLDDPLYLERLSANRSRP
jgi:2-amino-4-hydroxy-6-hydroxymethyldihydropteridine diphosphokinase